MSLTPLTAVTPIDGRYISKTSSLQAYFSESALIKFRIKVEIEYFIALCNSSILQLNHFPANKFTNLRDLYNNFTESDAQKIKDIEKITNHDVKAVEYFIKEKFDKLGLQEFKEFVHFGLTSQDINNTAIPYSIKEAVNKIYLPQLTEILTLLKDRVQQWKAIPLLARTHGQAASPTRMGKEIQVFIERIEKQLTLLETIPFSAKFGGATGNFNAHHIAFPKIDWVNFANTFTADALGLERQQTTTQIEHYDNLAALMDNISRINTILIDFSRDIWTYVSMDYFKQKIKKGEVGSSAMPHKVNPIDFENAEGNLGMANAIFRFLSSKLPISRLQRDLTDSTVLRNIGVPFAHTIIAFASLDKGIGKLLINQENIAADLEKNWVVVAEAIQTILRREGYPNPYEALKDLTRTNTVINAESIASFIDTLNINDTIKEELKAITPNNYTGI
ncbi:MAG TPA: adenylosuccinate lyase [Flavobacteriales bacterium]|nr:adenylosuccinate lyase [Flavobacteriales bacterium]HIK63313.1 adenylosuccinate lyase [Flavobacteriales bacterium]